MDRNSSHREGEQVLTNLAHHGVDAAGGLGRKPNQVNNSRHTGFHDLRVRPRFTPSLPIGAQAHHRTPLERANVSLPVVF